jgi:hypothetical protein
MTCIVCKHEFCWFCLGPAPGHVHDKKALLCPYRWFATNGAVVLLLFLLNFKLTYSVNLIYEFETILFDLLLGILSYNFVCIFYMYLLTIAYKIKNGIMEKREVV